LKIRHLPALGRHHRAAETDGRRRRISPVSATMRRVVVLPQPDGPRAPPLARRDFEIEAFHRGDVAVALVRPFTLTPGA
jgi:hypothetical protein